MLLARADWLARRSLSKYYSPPLGWIIVNYDKDNEHIDNDDENDGIYEDRYNTEIGKKRAIMMALIIITTEMMIMMTTINIMMARLLLRRGQWVGACNSHIKLMSWHFYRLIYFYNTVSSMKERQFRPSDAVTSISFLWLVMALPRESHSREIRSKNKSVYENGVTRI